MNGITVFEKAGTQVVTGCKNIPVPGKKFCNNCKDMESPSLSSESVSNETRMALRKSRKETEYSKDAPIDTVYNIETILDIKDAEEEQKSNQCHICKKLFKLKVNLEKHIANKHFNAEAPNTAGNTKKYLVKWQGYPVDSATWEHESNIPLFVKKHFDRKESFGGPIPKPSIKKSKKVGSGKYHLLSWDNDDKEKWVPDEYFQVLMEDGEVSSVIDDSCQTRKSRDKRVLRHTVGILVGAYPCGIATLIDELYGCESLSQVYGIVVDHFSKMSESSRDRLEELVYDDACHLKKFCEAEKRANRNEFTRKLAEIGKRVDNFHFPNHVDAWCQQNCNPKDSKNLDGVNTPICEQLFSRLNRYTNTKAMNEASFGLFFLYNLDLHNLNLEGKLNSIAHPHSQHRQEFLNGLRDMSHYLDEEESISNDSIQAKENDALPNIIQINPNEKSLSNSVEDLLDELTLTDFFSCELCDATFKKEAFLFTHINTKHNVKKFVCDVCDEDLGTARKLERHKNSQHSFKCKHCELVLNTKNELTTHMSMHCVCQVCGKQFDKMWKLTKHMSCHK